MPRLNQIIAIEKGVKTSSYTKLTEAHKKLQKASLLSGLSRTYRPKDDDGDQLPPESTRVQLKADHAIQETAQVLTDLFDITATKDWGNCEARADVGVDGDVVIESFGPEVKVVAKAAAIWRKLARKDSDIATKGLYFLKKTLK